jgi:hypothetical protein
MAHHLLDVGGPVRIAHTAHVYEFHLNIIMFNVDDITWSVLILSAVGVWTLHLVGTR